MSELPTRDDLLHRKALEAEKDARRREWALYEERELVAARIRYWEMVEEFVDRARELGLQPQLQHSPLYRGSTPWITWVEGYPLTGGAVVSAPPMRYGTAERRRVLRPQPQVHEVEEISLFVVSTGNEAGLGAGLVEEMTASQGTCWPPIDRLDNAASALLALERKLVASLLVLMDSDEARPSGQHAEELAKRSFQAADRRPDQLGEAVGNA